MAENCQIWLVETHIYDSKRHMPTVRKRYFAAHRKVTLHEYFPLVQVKLSIHENSRMVGVDKSNYWYTHVTTYIDLIAVDLDANWIES